MSKAKKNARLRLARNITRLVCSAAIFAIVPAYAQAGSALHWQHYPNPPKAPQGAPNVLIIMTDDVGFGASSGLGGPIPTPTFDTLASDGLLYNEFHTTAMCSPTRAALLTGRNHHHVGSGAIADMSVDEPGYTSVIPDSAVTIAKVLGENGYNTGWFGKNHNTPIWEYTSVGPFKHWPNGMGFDYFYGFNGGMTDQFYPSLVENRTLIEAPKQPGYILDRDLADHAISWLERQHSISPSAPFFLYYAPGSPHHPLQAPKTWIKKFKGAFDAGWDVQRQKTFARQKAEGIIPANADLTPRPAQIPAWDSLTSDQKKVAARMMEVYAAALAYCDDQIGRVVDHLKKSGQLDNTIVIFVQGDNGAAAENLNSEYNMIVTYMGGKGDLEYSLKNIDKIGGPESFPAYPAGWAWAMDTPFQWSKQVASHFGGTRNGLAIYWPKGIHSHGLRTQFHHVIDIVPTIYSVTGIKPPAVVDGVKQMPLDGVSMAYSFEHPNAPSTHHSQYFEMLGNRAFYKDGWLAATTPKRMPWEAYMPADERNTPYHWELYHVATDFSEAHDLAASNPAKLKALQADFLIAAKKYQVLPIDDSFLPRFSSKLRPSPLSGRTDFKYYRSSTRYTVAAFPGLAKNWNVSSQLRLLSGNDSGPIIVRGNRFSGWGLFLKRGVPMLVYRSTDNPKDEVVLTGRKLPAGKHIIAVEVRTKGANKITAYLIVDGTEVAQHRLSHIALPRVDTFIGRAPTVPLLESSDMPHDFSGEIVELTVKLKG